MTYYLVTAKRWARGWELHISNEDGEVGVTQSRTLAGAEAMVRDYLATDRDEDPTSSFSVEIQPELDTETAQAVQHARQSVRALEQAQREAAAESRAIAQKLKTDGLSGADIAVVMGVSTQRVSQLVNG